MNDHVLGGDASYAFLQSGILQDGLCLTRQEEVSEKLGQGSRAFRDGIVAQIEVAAVKFDDSASYGN